MKILITLISLLAFAGSTFAAETVGEKIDAKVNDVKRSAKHTVNIGKETVCNKGDSVCFAEKAKHRGGEAKDYAKDKTKEVKNDLDNTKD